jgi:hypothetical protein
LQNLGTPCHQAQGVCRAVMKAFQKFEITVAHLNTIRQKPERVWSGLE